MKIKLIFLLAIFLSLDTIPLVAATTGTKVTSAKDEYEYKRAIEQSNANKLLTTGSTAATGIGGMELAQGLSEQKADRTAEQSMSAYISTMRCEYGNGKQVKAGMDEIELPGGNDANLMKYRAEYMSLAADLKERKTALGLKPGIESEEILDKSQMGLYDDNNIGIDGGAYASLYRAQMLGSEKDQEQIDAAKQTSKNRVIGGAVAAGVGVVGGIVGDELINQSLSSSTKTAQTCTESGGTWQSGKCHCPDGFIQRTKTGPCFEEKTEEIQTSPTPPQDNFKNLSNGGGSGQSGDGDGGNGNNGGSGQSGGSDGSNGGGSGETDDAAVIEYEKSEMCRKFDGNWQNGECLCTKTFQSNEYITCMDLDIDFDESLIIEEDWEDVAADDEQTDTHKKDANHVNSPTVATAATSAHTPQQEHNNEHNSSDSPQQSSTTPQVNNTNTSRSAETPVTEADNEEPTNVATNTQQTQTESECGVVGKKECDPRFNYKICEMNGETKSCSDPGMLPPNATAGHCVSVDRGNYKICTATSCETGYTVSQGHCATSKVTNRNSSSQNPNTSTATRPNNTAKTTTSTSPQANNQSSSTSSQTGSGTNQAATTQKSTNYLKDQNMSLNGTYVKAKNIKNGQCDILKTKWNRNQPCDKNMNNGDWIAKFDYGVVRGESKCAKNKGDVSYARVSSVQESGNNCWCKVSKYSKGELGMTPYWVYLQSYQGTGDSDCSQNCANLCAKEIIQVKAFREKVFK